MTITCGIDWSERHHDVAVVDERGLVLGRRRIGDDAAGFARLQQFLAELTEQAPREIPIAIETDRGLLVAALRAAGFSVYAINPRAVARYRERHGQAGGKSDAGDAAVLAHILRTDRAMHRCLPADTDLATAVKHLARHHQEAVWARQQTGNRVRSLLREFYPAALVAFPNLTHKAALAVLRAAPTPADATRLSPAQVTALLRRCGRGDRPGLAERIVRQLQTCWLRQPLPVERGLGVALLGLLQIIEAMQAAIAELERALAHAFSAHPHAAVMTSVPGLGPVLAARVLGELGHDPARFASADGLRAYAGTAPITRTSGRSRQVSARHICNRRLADACHWWAFSAITNSVGARALYDQRRAAGEAHNAALRNLANRLMGRLWHCLQTGTDYDEQAAWPPASCVSPA